MQHREATTRSRPPWYLWPLVPVAFVATLPVILPLALLALVSIPLTFVYPDRHKHLYDVGGTSAQKARLAQWRDAYERLGFLNRLRRAKEKIARHRRRRAA
jgi:hypothetical protein